MKRTIYCGAPREADVGRTVACMGWVQTKRDMGGVIFLDLRDREGTLQVVCNASSMPAEDFSLAEGVHNQSVVAVRGVLRLRDAETYNPKLDTGAVELAAAGLSVLSSADPLPFSLDDGAAVREDLRLKYRFLDLRRPKMQENLRFRHTLVRAVRDYLDEDGFVEVETPILTKSTPEGARDYLVPSRVHPGMFYALPQSPQIFKQLLMVGGVDKYYQVARCFRDEDLRADRQPEFTQVDMELSFVDQEDILVHLEKLFKRIFRSVMKVDLAEPFPRLTWREAMDLYGSDKPDLRFGLPIADLTDIAAGCSFSVFRKVCDKGGVVRAINVKGKADFTRTEIELLTDKATGYGAKGMAWIALRPDGEIYSILTKYLTAEELDAMIARAGGEPGDFILFCADKLSTVRRTLGGLRLDLGDMLNLRPRDEYRFLFVTDFPEFEYSEEEKRYVATHHPFTMPYPEDIPYLTSAPERVRAQAYDVVLNGTELGSGSIRIHDRELQKRMFEALGFSEEEAEERFGFMINAFRYGTPPHGGFAFGLDRLAMLCVGASSLRDIIAFPKVRDASCLMSEAPNAVDEEQLKVLSLGTTAEKPAEGGKRSKKPASRIDVGSVASLAKLDFTEKERESLPAELGAILRFADQLSEIDTERIPTTAHVVPLSNIFREDRPHTEYTRSELLANAKTQADGYIVVPRVVEGV